MENHSSKDIDIAVLIPCYNEASTISNVVADFKAALPEARIYVYDNYPTDATGRIAKDAGAIVGHEQRQGKGYVVRRMFQEIDADYYVLVDGDGTYPASKARRLLEPALNGKAHMVVGTRLEAHEKGSFRSMHKFGNNLITKIINILFGTRLTDILSGYRVLSKSLAKGLPLISKGFEIETEMTLNALDAGLNIVEIPIPYGSRPDGSYSKLSTYRDGLLILATILTIFKDYRPLLFFGFLFLVLLIAGLSLGVPVVIEYARTGLVKRFPTAILAASLELLAFQMIGVGLVLDTMARHRRYRQELTLRKVMSRAKG